MAINTLLHYFALSKWYKTVKSLVLLTYTHIYWSLVFWQLSCFWQNPTHSTQMIILYIDTEIQNTNTVNYDDKNREQHINLSVYLCVSYIISASYWYYYIIYYKVWFYKPKIDLKSCANNSCFYKHLPNNSAKESRCMLNCEKKSQLKVTQGLISKSEVTRAVTTITTHSQHSANDFCQRRPTVQKTLKCLQDGKFMIFRDQLSVFPFLKS